MLNDLIAKIVIKEKDPKATKVPITPKSAILFKLAKKFPLFILKPEANTIGGKQKKKNVVSSNFSKLIIASLSECHSKYDINIPIIE